MKKVILGVLALIFTIALVIAGYMMFASPNLQKHTVTDAPCPYTWKELRDGTVRLEINTLAYPDHNWNVECYPKNVVAVTREESTTETVVFSILPLNAGQSFVQVFCEQAEPFTVRVFEIGMQIEVSDENALVIEETTQKAYEGMADLGKAGGNLSYWVDPNGAINLLIEEESGIWEAVDYDAESISVNGPFYREASCGFEILGKKAGTFPLTISNGEDKTFLLNVVVAEDLTATITELSEDDHASEGSEEENNG